MKNKYKVLRGFNDKLMNEIYVPEGTFLEYDDKAAEELITDGTLELYQLGVPDDFDQKPKASKTAKAAKKPKKK